jgi:deoxyribonuclease-4
VRFGAHVRRGSQATTGVVAECRLRHADCAQVFLSNPRAWAPPSFGDGDALRFRDAWRSSGLTPLAAHAPYVVNIASPDPRFLRRSRTLARRTAAACDRLGVDLLVLHAGAGGSAPPRVARRRAVATLRETLAASTRVRVLVELMAGTRGAVASTIAEAAELVADVDDPRIGLCLDTCHLFAAGAPLDTADGVATVVDDLTREGLVDLVGLVHANDSAFPRGERRDRHAPIGEGLIGLAGWRALLARPEVDAWAFVLETPGDAGSHAEQIALLRSLAPAGAQGSSSALGPS